MNSREHILECAERIVVRDGVGRLTLDAVAAEAGFSKGGVLYHFRTKDDLVRGMVARLIEEFDGEIARHASADPEPVGRLARAYLKMAFPEPSSLAEHHQQVAAALRVAINNNPSLMQPVCDVRIAFQKRILEDGLDPVTARLIQLAADGLWMAEVLGLPVPGGPERAAVLDRLEALTRR
ncbi:MAG: TetR/AcrR family transcriptional regulator [Bryobacteraceae bacterium]